MRLRLGTPGVPLLPTVVKRYSLTGNVRGVGVEIRKCQKRDLFFHYVHLPSFLIFNSFFSYFVKGIKIKSLSYNYETR